MVSKSGGAFLRPQTATRMGWNIGPAFSPRRSAAARRADFERCVIEGRGGQQLTGFGENPAGQRRIALLRNQLQAIIRRKLRGEKEVGGGD